MSASVGVYIQTIRPVSPSQVHRLRKDNHSALLDHIYSTYANISASALQDNDKRLHSPYDSNQPLETLIDQIKNAVDYASAGETPYTPAQVVGIAFQLMFQTGIFNDDCKLWQRQPVDVKTWNRIKELCRSEERRIR